MSIFASPRFKSYRKRLQNASKNTPKGDFFSKLCHLRARVAPGVAQSWSRELSAPLPGCPGRSPGHLENLCFPYGKPYFSSLRALRIPHAEETAATVLNDPLGHFSPPPLLSFSHPSTPPFRSSVFEHRGGTCPPRRTPRGVGGLTGLRPLPPAPKQLTK